MFQSRRKKAEIEAKQDPNYIPTKELKPNVEEEKTPFPWGMTIFVGVLVVLIVACVIVIFALK